MGTPRLEHLVVPLLDGRVLVVGGGFDDQLDTSAEVYDPATRTWSATGSMLNAHTRFPATLLDDGRVLVGGAPPAQDLRPRQRDLDVRREDGHAHRRLGHAAA